MPAPTPEQLELIRRSAGLSLDAEGELLHEGERIAHPGLHALFQAGLDLKNGEAIVRVGEQWAYVQSAETPLVVQHWRATVDNVTLRLNTGQTLEIPLDQLQLKLQFPHTLLVTLPDGRPARLGRRTWHAVAQGLEELADGQVVLRIGNRNFAL